MIPVTSVMFGTEEEELVLEVLRSGQLAQGIYVERFEHMFAELHRVPHAIAVNNGTTALRCRNASARASLGRRGDRRPFTFVATLNAILEAGATARFADIGDDFNDDVRPDAVSALTDQRAHEGADAVHLYGYLADMDPLERVARKHDLAVVEDAASCLLAPNTRDAVPGASESAASASMQRRISPRVRAG